MCHRLDDRFFARLSGLDPAVVCARTLASYDSDRRAYRVLAMNEEVEVDLAAREIRRTAAHALPVTVELGLAAIFYLMESDGEAPTGRWVSEKELRGGAQFFQGPHSIPTRPIAEACTGGLDKVIAAGAAFGAVPIAMGDAAFSFDALPKVPLAVVLWRGDDEFPPECRILMDETIDRHLPLDVIYGLAIETARRLTGLSMAH